MKAGFVVYSDPVKNLEQIKGGKLRVILRKAIRAGSKPLVQAMKAAVPVATGHLKKSIGVRITTTRSKQIVAVIGPKRRYTKTTKAGRVQTATKYRHLAERGRGPVKLLRVARKDRLKRGMPIAPGVFRGSSGPARGKPFVIQAGNAATQALDIVRQKTAEGIQQALAKVAARGKR